MLEAGRDGERAAAGRPPGFAGVQVHACNPRRRPAATTVRHTGNQTSRSMPWPLQFPYPGSQTKPPFPQYLAVPRQPVCLFLHSPPRPRAALTGSARTAWRCMKWVRCMGMEGAKACAPTRRDDTRRADFMAAGAEGSCGFKRTRGWGGRARVERGLAVMDAGLDRVGMG